jgi:hypothetical protein
VSRLRRGWRAARKLYGAGRLSWRPSAARAERAPLWPEQAGDDPRDAIFLDSDQPDIVVPIEKCSGYVFTRFGPQGNCPMQSAAAIYSETRRPEDVEEHLFAFYQRFQPRNLAEALLSSDDPDLALLTAMSPFDQFQPWRPSIIRMSGHEGGGNQNFGPVTAAKLEVEVGRLTKVFDSFMRVGYRPEAYKDGFIRGYFLLDGDDYRFLVNRGMHRLSILAALGAPRIWARFSPKLPRHIDAARMELWPHVKSGFCPATLARRLVRRHFA